ESQPLRTTANTIFGMAGGLLESGGARALATAEPGRQAEEGAPGGKGCRHGRLFEVFDGFGAPAYGLAGAVPGCLDAGVGGGPGGREGFFQTLSAKGRTGCSPSPGTSSPARSTSIKDCTRS